MKLKQKFNWIKPLLYLLAGLILSTRCLASNTDKLLFDKGNALYAKGKYNEALMAYQAVIKDGYQSAALFFNTGNAFYRTGDIPSAIWYYEKAHKLSPGDEDIIFNIRLVNLKTTDKVEEAPTFFLTNWWNRFMLALPVDTFAAISLLLLLSASGILILYFFSYSVTVKKVSFFCSILLFFAGIFAIFIAGSQASYFKSRRQAIIFNNTVEIKSAPAPQSKTAFVLHEGTKVNVVDKINGWIRIKMVNGTEGWMRAADVREI